jgi:hypothetical protein
MLAAMGRHNAAFFPGNIGISRPWALGQIGYFQSRQPNKA